MYENALFKEAAEQDYDLTLLRVLLQEGDAHEHQRSFITDS
jgi:hypothetical protein